MARVALVVSPELAPHAVAENGLVLAALRERGVEGVLVEWRREACPPVDACIVRTPWDYVDAAPEFLAWLDATAQRTAVLNPPQVVRWNHHKGYLVRMAEAGLPVPESLFVARGSPARDLPWARAVVKPAVGAGGRGAVRVATHAEGRRALAELLAHGDALAQPYLPEIEREGERSLIFIDGELSHTVVKRPQAGDFRIHTYYGGTTERHEPTDAELDVARRVTAAAPGELLYARVDVVPTARGPLLMELEVIEPYLYSDVEPQVATRLAAAIARRVR